MFIAQFWVFLLDFYGILWYFMAGNGTVWHKKE
jgi:hypothetical protein